MKSIAYISSFLIISIVSFFQTQKSITIDFSMPSEISAGNEFVLEANVKKGDISNFSKLQLKLPQGFTAELIEGKGGTFTYFENEIKLIWISLPYEPEFKVTFKITTDASATGTHSFKGKISYILDTERGKTELSTPSITVKPSSNNTATANSGTQTTSTSINTSTAPGKIACERSIDKTSVSKGSSAKVELNVSKSGISGLGKIIESLPEGFTAKEIQANGAIFSFSGNEVKFLWMTLPAEDNFTVSYELIPNANADGNKVIEGVFSYIEEQETKKVLIGSTSIAIGEDLAATTSTENTDNTDNTATTTDNTTTSNTTNNIDNTRTTENNSDVTTDNSSENEPNTTSLQDNSDETTASSQTETNTSTSNQATQTNTAENTETTSIQVDDNSATTDNNTTENTTVNTSNPANTSKNVNYRVQICATKKPVDTQYFVKNNNIQEEIYTNMHEGWHKFTVGNFPIYKEARDHREFIKANKKVVGPFVTAYNDGKRITVQEALMITKHQWMP